MGNGQATETKSDSEKASMIGSFLFFSITYLSMMSKPTLQWRFYCDDAGYFYHISSEKVFIIHWYTLISSSIIAILVPIVL